MHGNHSSSPHDAVYSLLPIVVVDLIVVIIIYVVRCYCHRPEDKAMSVHDDSAGRFYIRLE